LGYFKRLDPRRRIGRFFPELAEALSGRSLEALPARIAERKTGGRAKINILRYKNQDEHENGEHDFACRRHGSAQNWSARVKLTLDIATVVDSRWLRGRRSAIIRSELRISAMQFPQCDLRTASSGRRLFAERAMHWEETEFLWVFGVSALRGNTNGIVGRKIFPFKTGYLIEKNVIER